MSSSTLTAAALAQHSSSSGKNASQNHSTTDKLPPSNNSAKNNKDLKDNHVEPNYEPPVQSTSSFPASPLSPSTSNSDVEGSYVPPSLLSLQHPVQSTPAALKASESLAQHGTSASLPSSSLMAESPAEETAQNQAGEPIARRTAHRLGSGYKKAITPGARGSTHSMHRLTPANRSASMNSELEFQQKLKSIGSDILSVSCDVSYDDADVDATYVEVEDGIEEEDNEDGASV